MSDCEYWRKSEISAHEWKITGLGFFLDFGTLGIFLGFMGFLRFFGILGIFFVFFGFVGLFSGFLGLLGICRIL